MDSAVAAMSSDNIDRTKFGKYGFTIPPPQPFLNFWIHPCWNNIQKWFWIVDNFQKRKSMTSWLRHHYVTTHKHLKMYIFCAKCHFIWSNNTDFPFLISNNKVYSIEKWR